MTNYNFNKFLFVLNCIFLQNASASLAGERLMQHQLASDSWEELQKIRQNFPLHTSEAQKANEEARNEKSEVEEKYQSPFFYSKSKSDLPFWIKENSDVVRIVDAPSKNSKEMFIDGILPGYSANEGATQPVEVFEHEGINYFKMPVSFRGKSALGEKGFRLVRACGCYVFDESKKSFWWGSYVRYTERGFDLNNQVVEANLKLYTTPLSETNVVQAAKISTVLAAGALVWLAYKNNKISFLNR